MSTLSYPRLRKDPLLQLQGLSFCDALIARASCARHRGASTAQPVAGVDVVSWIVAEERRPPPAAISIHIGHLPAYGSNRATFIDHPVKSILNSPESTRMGFWSINPYVGCEYGCSYCYARFAHRYTMERAHAAGALSLDSSDEAFEHRIFVKRRQTVLAALQRDVVRMGSKAPNQRPNLIVIGTATDPYQPAEHRYQITRAILEWLIDIRGLSIGVTTKSPLVSRDIDLFAELGRNHRVAVYISLISTNVRVIKLFEACSPMPHARLRALRELSDAGITVGINAAPVLPGITDSLLHIDALVAAAKEAGALFVHPSVIRLHPEVSSRFLPLVDEHFSDLVARYRAAYRGNCDAPLGYVDAVERRFRRVTRKYGLSADDPLSVSQEWRVEREEQLSFL